MYLCYAGYKMTSFCLTGHLTQYDIPDGTSELRVYNYSGTSLIVPPSVTMLFCITNRHLTELIVPPSVNTLCCFDNQLTELIVPSSVTSLNCSGNQLTKLIVPPFVIDLDCSDNQLKELIVPPSVTFLNCSDNQLTELIAPSVTFLNCFNNTFSKEILLIRGKVSAIRKRIAVRKAVRRMRKQFYRRKKNVLNEITSRPSGTVGTWDIGGNIFQENMKEAFK